MIKEFSLWAKYYIIVFDGYQDLAYKFYKTWHSSSLHNRFNLIKLIQIYLNQFKNIRIPYNVYTMNIHYRQNCVCELSTIPVKQNLVMYNNNNNNNNKINTLLTTKTRVSHTIFKKAGFLL